MGYSLRTLYLGAVYDEKGYAIIGTELHSHPDPKTQSKNDKLPVNIARCCLVCTYCMFFLYALTMMYLLDALYVCTPHMYLLYVLLCTYSMYLLYVLLCTYSMYLLYVLTLCTYNIRYVPRRECSLKITWTQIYTPHWYRPPALRTFYLPCTM